LPEDHPRREYAADKFYSTDVFGDYALDFIADARRTPWKPWFLYLAFNAAHFPLHAPDAEIAKYERTYAQGWDKIREQRFQRQRQLGLLPKDTELTPRSSIPANRANKQTGWADKTNPAWELLPADRRADLARRMAVYAAMVDRMDQNIGRVIADLRQHGELDNTLVIFLSDNGACAEWDPYGFDGSSGPHNVLHTGDALKKVGGPDSYVSYGSGWANACNTPWRLYKHYDHEGGIATPSIVRWPGGVKRAGGISTTPSHIIDFMPTFLEIAGASYPKTYKDHAILPMEGRSLLPVLKDAQMPARALFYEHEGNRAVRDGQWKLVALDNHPWELYDLDRDRSELHDLAQRRPETVRRLAAEWDQWALRCLVRRPKTTVAPPQVANKALTISCEVAPESANGVILAQGGRQEGYALWLREGKLVFTVRLHGSPTSIEAATMPTGRLVITARLNHDASMELVVNGNLAAKGKAPGLIRTQPKDGLSIGEDDYTAVGDYQPPNPLRGTVEQVRVLTD
jgi:arylsulfatase A-like enzyme